jgi:hypothetical protein
MKANQLSDIYRFNRSFVRNGELFGHSGMTDLVVRAAAARRCAKDAMLAADRLHIIDPPVTRQGYGASPRDAC